MKGKKQRIRIFRIEEGGLVLPYVTEGIKAGFPSPAQDYIKESIDLNKVLIKDKSSTFLAKADGESLNGSIRDGDIMIIDRSLNPRNGQKVVVFVDGEFTTKILKKEKDAVYLLPDNPDFPVLKITPDQDLRIWGVVTYIIRKMI